MRKMHVFVTPRIRRLRLILKLPARLCPPLLYVPQSHEKHPDAAAIAPRLVFDALTHFDLRRSGSIIIATTAGIWRLR